MYKILEKTQFSEKVFKFRIEAPAIAKHAHAGQFLMVRANETGERVPFTLAGWNGDEGWVLGYTEEMAVNEAKRCLNCKNKPCRRLPRGHRYPRVHRQVAEGFEGAYQINRSSSLPAVCGRVCPQESQCEGKCVRGIKGEPVAIGRLERFVADWHRENVHAKRPSAPNGHKVAVIGSGPSGLTCAGDLAKKGYEVTVFEALHTGRRRAGVRHPRVPSAQGHRAEGDRRPEGHGRQDRDNMVIGKVLTIDELLRSGLRGRVRRLRRRSARSSWTSPARTSRAFLRQRVPDPHQPDEGLQARLRHPIMPHPRQERRRRRRRQRGYGRRPLRQASGRETCTSSTAAARRSCPPVRKSRARQGRGHRSSCRCATPRDPRDENGSCAPSVRPRWSSASPTRPAAAARSHRGQRV